MPEELTRWCRLLGISTPEAGYHGDGRSGPNLVSSWLVSTLFASLLCALQVWPVSLPTNEDTFRRKTTLDNLLHSPQSVRCRSPCRPMMTLSTLENLPHSPNLWDVALLASLSNTMTSFDCADYRRYPYTYPGG